MVDQPDFWVCILSRVQSCQEFLHLSLLNKAAASAARLVCNTVAKRLAKLELTLRGWSYCLGTGADYHNGGKAVLHGTYGTWIPMEGCYLVKEFAYGRRVPGEYTVAPYEEPEDFSLELVKYIRTASYHANQWSSIARLLPRPYQVEVPQAERTTHTARTPQGPIASFSRLSNASFIYY